MVTKMITIIKLWNNNIVVYKMSNKISIDKE
jgi:hypothetical protein